MASVSGESWSLIGRAWGTDAGKTPRLATVALLNSLITSLSWDLSPSSAICDKMPGIPSHNQ